jgi:hypothetical protein
LSILLPCGVHRDDGQSNDCHRLEQESWHAILVSR